MKNRKSFGHVPDGSQLPLPGFMPETSASRQATASPPVKFRRGYVRTTRDPDVARSYSDNVALGYAVAQGLAKALSTLSPGELAALRARVVEEKEEAATARASHDRRAMGGRG
ncbi:MAG TPA: hypothetical protein VF960_07415 [Chloroflexota bacterium]